MALYTGDCFTDLPAHECHPCQPDSEKETGRVRSAGFIFSDYYADIKANPTNLNAWTIGIQSGKIIVVPETSGEYDPGDPKELPGYGDKPVSYGPRTMTLKFNDPNLAANYAHYNALGTQSELIPFFRTSSQLRLFDKAAAITAKDPVADDHEAEVRWEVSARVTSSNLPSYHLAATLLNTIFKCSYLNNIITGGVEPVFDTILTHDSATTDTAESVTSVVAANDAEQELRFNKITSPVGLPLDMEISVDGVEAMTVTFKTEYLGKPFRYIHTDGTGYSGTFTNGEVEF